MANRHFIFFALASHGEGLSGSDRIYIELARVWGQTEQVDICVWREGQKMIDRQKLDYSLIDTSGVADQKSAGVFLHVVRLGLWAQMGFVICYLARIVAGIALGLSLRVTNGPETYVYSSNDFWMDLLPGLLLKLRFPKITWISSFYLAAPNLFRGFDETGRSSFKLPNLKLIIYWLQQIPTYFMTYFLSDYVFVTSDPDRIRFPRQDKAGKVVVVRGGVRLEPINKWRENNKHIKKKYLAVFQGRFHPQKGAVELVYIWAKVVEKVPTAKLAMIGDGGLMPKVKRTIAKLNLEKNIKLFGYVYDGIEKYQLFAQSRIVVHPAVYDSGGMASAEAMAFGLPAVGFDLHAYQSYYPKGMLKVTSGDLTKFAGAIISLDSDSQLYNKYHKEALDLIVNHWSWRKRAQEILAQII